jgi:hypothetical protein
VYRALVGEPDGKRLLGRPLHRRGKVLKWILKMHDGVEWTALFWFRIRINGRLL